MNAHSVIYGWDAVSGSSVNGFQIFKELNTFEFEVLDSSDEVFLKIANEFGSFGKEKPERTDVNEFCTRISKSYFHTHSTHFPQNGMENINV